MPVASPPTLGVTLNSSFSMDICKGSLLETIKILLIKWALLFCDCFINLELLQINSNQRDYQSAMKSNKKGIYE